MIANAFLVPFSLQCDERGLGDFVQVVGLGMATELGARMNVFRSYCGVDTRPGK